jgi:hypothetical protein
MKRGIGFGIAWVGATVVAIVIAAAAVGSVRSQVTETPTQLGSPSAAALAVTPVELAPETTVPAPPTVIAPPTTVTPENGITVTTSTTSPSSAAPQTSTTNAPSTTTPAARYSKSYNTAGGSVTIVVSGENVTFGGAVPTPGWKIEVENYGPEKVEVHFEEINGEGEIKFEARIENGELDVRID